MRYVNHEVERSEWWHSQRKLLQLERETKRERIVGVLLLVAITVLYFAL